MFDDRPEQIGKRPIILGMRFRRGHLSAAVTAVAAAIVLPVLVAPAPAAAGPATCVPFGTAQLPPGAPATGDRTGFDDLPRYQGTGAPAEVELRTERMQFNKYWEFALVGHTLIARPRHTGTWRVVPLPSCLRGQLTAISLDDDEMVGIDGGRWIYTMDNVTHSPRLWNWTSRFGAMLWFGDGQTLPPNTVRPHGWALSVTSPSDNREYLDIAGRVHPSGQAKMTMIPALVGDGSRIVYADPWLPNDRSYEISSPLGGRFRSVALSASASTMLVINRYGDMFTRTFDFDSSGSDSVFFRYSWESQDGLPSATDLTQETWDRSTAAVQLPAPDWKRQPKIPGEITSRSQSSPPGRAPNAANSASKDVRTARSATGARAYTIRPGCSYRPAGHCTDRSWTTPARTCPPQPWQHRRRGTCRHLCRRAPPSSTVRR